MQAFTLGWVWQLRRGLGFVFLMINQTNSSHTWMYYGLTTKSALNLLYPFSMKQKCLIWTRIIAWDREQNATQVDIMLIWQKRSEYYRAGEIHTTRGSVLKCSPLCCCSLTGKAKHALPHCCSSKRIRANEKNIAFMAFSYDIQGAIYFHGKVISDMAGT